MTLQRSGPEKETALAILELIGTQVDDDDVLKAVSSQLVLAMSDPDNWLKSLAQSAVSVPPDHRPAGQAGRGAQRLAFQIVNLARHQGKTPYKLLYPHFKEISVQLVDALLSSPSLLSDFVTLVSETKENFLTTNLHHIIPHLVLTNRKDLIAALASMLDRTPVSLVVAHIQSTLFRVLMRDADETERGISILLKLTEANKKGIKPSDLVTIAETCPLLFLLVVELGNEDETVVARVGPLRSVYNGRDHRWLTHQPQAEAGLAKVSALLEKSKRKAPDLGEFLKPYMLGIISHLNDTLQDARGRKSVEDKTKVIRSVGALVTKIGLTMSTYSQQVSHRPSSAWSESMP